MRIPMIRFRRLAPDDSTGMGAAPAVIDAVALARLHELDPNGERGFVRQVLTTYEASLVRHMARLSAGDGAQPEAAAAGEVAHTLKSSSASVGALTFSQRCAEVERLAKGAPNGELMPALQAMLAEGQRVLTTVRAMLHD